MKMELRVIGIFLLFPLLISMAGRVAAQTFLALPDIKSQQDLDKTMAALDLRSLMPTTSATW